MEAGTPGVAADVAAFWTVLRPDAFGAWRARGDALGALGRRSEARDAYTRALELAPDRRAHDTVMRSIEQLG